jgi:hypothetical protein
MLAICHGQAAAGATHVPTSLQSNITWLASSKDASCATTDDGYVSCWGNGIQTPDPSWYCAGNAVQVELAESNHQQPPGFGRGTLGVIACRNGDFSLWSSYDGSLTFAFPTSLSFLSTGRTNICVTRQDNDAYCFGGSSTIQDLQQYFAFIAPYQGQIIKAFSGDEGGCLYLQDESIECFGRYSLTNVVPRPGIELQNAAISGAAMCFGWADGWSCQVANASLTLQERTAVEALTTLWPLVSDTPLYMNGNPKPVVLGGLDVSATWGTPQGQLCAILDNHQTWCQGTGFNQDSPDVVDGIFSINSQNTFKSEQIAIASSHVCVRVSDPSQLWPWLIFGIIVLIVIVLFWWAYRVWKQSKLRESNPFKYFGIEN